MLKVLFSSITLAEATKTVFISGVDYNERDGRRRKRWCKRAFERYIDFISFLYIYISQTEMTIYC